MRHRYIPAFIMLLAGAVTCAVSLIKKFDVLYSLELLFGTLLIFYIIGLTVKKIADKKLEIVITEEETEEAEDGEKEDAGIPQEGEEKEEKAGAGEEQP